MTSRLQPPVDDATDGIPDAPPTRRIFRWRRLLNGYSDRIAGTMTVFWLLVSLWGIGAALSSWKLEPDSELFAVLLLLSTALAGGLLVKLSRLPGLLGMLLVGLIWRNWNPSPVDVPSLISTRWSSILRNAATVIILLRGGYGLNHSTLTSNWPVIVRLSVLPCLLECACWTTGAHFLLDMPWLWAVLTGFALSAASAAVVIPMMLGFQEAGLGGAIPTVAIAATAIDNVLAMAGHGIVHSFIFSTDDAWHNLASIPIQVCVGIGFGFVWGTVLHFFPRSGVRQGHLVGGRLCLLLAGGIMATFGGKALNYSGAGPLACVIMAFVANISWRRRSGWGNPQQPNPIADLLLGLWIFFEALLFALIGTQIAIRQLNPRMIGYGVLVLFTALAVRFAVSFVAAMRTGFQPRERVFVAVTWLPKATVQAALGPVALETARRFHSGAEVEQTASDVLTLAALSILITAPLGALAIQMGGRRLLPQPLPNTTTPISNETDTLVS